MNDTVTGARGRLKTAAPGALPCLMAVYLEELDDPHAGSHSNHTSFDSEIQLSDSHRCKNM